MRGCDRGPLRLGPVLTFLLVLAGLTSTARAASIQAEIDRTEATLEERLVLTLTVTGSQRAQPVLPDLDAFEVVPAGQSKQWNFVNGRASSSVSYRFVLLPREEGEFLIGPASVEIDGERLTTEPISVRILAAGASPSQRRDLFLTVQVSTATPFVGQQVLFTWRLYRRVELTEARLTPFEFDGFLVENLGPTRELDATVNGLPYRVSEIRKALFPQEQGELVIPATLLTCEFAVRGRRGTFTDFFGRSSESRTLRSDPIRLEVRPLPPAPAGFSGLVGEFELSSKVSQLELQVGESVTLTVEVTGRGNVQMIPEPPLPELAAVKIYDDKPGSTIDRKSSGLSGSRTFRKALVPQAAGELILPPVRLVYFDPAAGDYRTAATGELALQVLPQEGTEELRLTETLAPNTGKVAVRILAEDILPVYASLDGIRGPPRPSGWLLGALLAAPPFLYLGALAAERRRRRYREDASLERRQRALSRARQRLRRLAEGGQAETTEELSRCLREYLGDKLGLEGIALTAADARNHLTGHGLEADQVDEVGHLLERLEAAHYGSASLDPRLPAQVSELVRRLDRKL